MIRPERLRKWMVRILLGFGAASASAHVQAVEPPPAPTFPKPRVRRAVDAAPISQALPPKPIQPTRMRPLPFEFANPYVVDAKVARVGHTEPARESRAVRHFTTDLPRDPIIGSPLTPTPQATFAPKPKQTSPLPKEPSQLTPDPTVAPVRLNQFVDDRPAGSTTPATQVPFDANRYRAAPSPIDPPSPIDLDRSPRPGRHSTDTENSSSAIPSNRPQPLPARQESRERRSVGDDGSFAPRFARPQTGNGDQVQPLPPPTPQRATEIHNVGDHYRVTMNLRDEDLRALLDLLSRDAQLNIVASNEVKGTVTASFTDVRVEDALNAILKMTGYVARREGDFLYVGTPADLVKMDQLEDVMTSRIFRTNYVTAAELQQLITPMLTEGVGVVTVSTASQVDIPADSVSTGGDSFAGNEVIMVRDYQRVVDRIDELIKKIDQRPRQVVIEAMIMSVNLDDSHRFGINFELFRAHDDVQLTSGSPLGSLGQIDVSTGGLSFGVLTTDVGGFINALETIGDTNVIAAPRLLCLNKQRAEILIGDQKGFISTTQTETSTTQTVEFLDIGTQLRIRPFISDDGIIRLEVHPELSTGEVKLLGGFALPEKSVTQVTTNIMCRDGATVVIGGLIREDYADNTSQVAGASSIPILNGLLRNVNETVNRNEIVVLITPRIVQDPVELAGESPPPDYFGRLAEAEAQRISPIARHHYSDRYYRLAHTAWSAGNVGEALRYVHLALRFKHRNIRARQLLNAIHSGIPAGAELTPGMHGPVEDSPELLPDADDVEMPDQASQPTARRGAPTRPRGIRPVRPAAYVGQR